MSAAGPPSLSRSAMARDPHDSPADDELVVAAAAGDRTAFDALVDRHWRIACSLAYQRLRSWADAEDAAQEAFVLAFRKLDTLREPARFGGWLYRIVHRTSIERIRRRKRRPELLVEEAETLGDDDADRQPDEDAPSPVGAPRDPETFEAIHDAIGALPERYRQVVMLRYGHELPVKEIGRVLGLPVGTVVSQMYRANRILRTRLRHLVRAS